MLLLILMRIILSSSLYIYNSFGEGYSIGNMITSSNKLDIRFEILRGLISENY